MFEAFWSYHLSEAGQNTVRSHWRSTCHYTQQFARSEIHVLNLNADGTAEKSLAQPWPRPAWGSATFSRSSLTVKRPGFATTLPIFRPMLVGFSVANECLSLALVKRMEPVSQSTSYEWTKGNLPWHHQCKSMVLVSPIDDYSCNQQRPLGLRIFCPVLLDRESNSWKIPTHQEGALVLGWSSEAGMFKALAALYVDHQRGSHAERPMPGQSLLFCHE